MDYLKVLFSIVFPFMIIHYMEDEKKETACLSFKEKREEEERSCCRKTMDIFGNLYRFYFHTPIVTFILHVFMNVCFLALYSYVVISTDTRITKGWMEILLALYIVSHVVGEFYQIGQVLFDQKLHICRALNIS